MSAQPPPLLNRVLVKFPGFYRTFQHADGGRVLRYDIGSLPYVIDEFISLSAVEIALTPRSPARPFTGHLAPIIRERVTVLDQAGEVDRELAAFVEPLVRDFGLQFKADGFVALDTAIPEEVKKAFTYFFPALYDFLLAGRARVQLDLDLERFKHAAEVLRSHTKNADGRAHLSMLLGVLNSYHALSVPGLSVPSVTAEEQGRRFKYLIEDLAYRSLSEKAALLGIPADAQRAARLMGRALTTLLETPVLKWGAHSVSKMLLTSHGVPGVDVDLAKLVVPHGYLPPIVSFQEAYRRALPEWRKSRPPASETGLYPRLFREGYTEVEDAPQPTLDDFQGKPLASWARGPEDDI